MITDPQTNFVYLSGLLPKRHPGVFTRLKTALSLKGISYGLLPHTRDIWCRDYMPIQVANDSFVQFKYDPRYLRAKKYRDTITDTGMVCEAIGIKPVQSEIRLDGGNVVASGERAIITDRIFSENPGHGKDRLVEELRELLRVKKVIIIPECPGDMTGHADGLVRFAHGVIPDNSVVYVSDLSRIIPHYFSKLHNSLTEAGLLPITMSYDSPERCDGIDATGTYINYLQAGKCVFYPEFGQRMNVCANKMFFKLFGSDAVPIETDRLAKDGGVLNCISWNILRKGKVS